MFVFLIEFGDVVNFIKLAINFYPLKAAFLQVAEFFAVFTLASSYNGGKKIKAGP